MSSHVLLYGRVGQSPSFCFLKVKNEKTWNYQVAYANCYMFELALSNIYVETESTCDDAATATETTSLFWVKSNKQF